MRKLWSQYRALLEEDLTRKVFDNVKNLLVCALLFAAGTNAVQGDHEVLLGLFVVKLTGWGLIAVSAVLLFLNVSDGLHNLAKLRYHRFFQIILFLVYLIFSIRAVEIMWSFRAA
ncbi:MAG: hypothetical protein V4812_03755 [Pseudomonadota bacterium]